MSNGRCDRCDKRVKDCDWHYTTQEEELCGTCYLGLFADTEVVPVGDVGINLFGLHNDRGTYLEPPAQLFDPMRLTLGEQGRCEAWALPAVCYPPNQRSVWESGESPAPVLSSVPNGYWFHIAEDGKIAKVPR